MTAARADVARAIELVFVALHAVDCATLDRFALRAAVVLSACVAVLSVLSAAAAPPRRPRVAVFAAEPHPAPDGRVGP